MRQIMWSRQIYAGALILIALVVTSCGGASPTVSPTPMEATCVSTEAYSLDLIMVTAGQEQIPTAFDAVNIGSCDFSKPVASLTIELLRAGNVVHTVAIPVSPEKSHLSLPFPDELPVPIVDATLEPGRYERRVAAADSDGNSVRVEGFDPVLVVRDPESTEASILKNRARWERSGITNYAYEMAWQCFCPPWFTALVNVVVVQGQVAALELVDSAMGPMIQAQERYVTIDGLFDFLQDALDRDAFQIRAEYGSELGYPREVFVDYSELMVDEELGFIVKVVRPSR